jgi:hypothetical protein
MYATIARKWWIQEKTDGANYVYMTTDTIIQNYQFHHYYNYVYMNKTIRFKKTVWPYRPTE